MVLPSGADTDPKKWCTAYDLDLDNCSYDHNYSMAFGGYSGLRNINQPVDCAGGPAAAWLFIDCQAYTGVGWYFNYREGNIDAMVDPWMTKAKYAFRHPGGRANAVYLDGHVGTLQHVSVTGKANWLNIWNNAPVQ